jgi:hypothetical protein
MHARLIILHPPAPAQMVGRRVQLEVMSSAGIFRDAFRSEGRGGLGSGFAGANQPGLCCATPLGLMFWAMGTQGRRSCLAPTLGFVVERRWRSMPVVFNTRLAFNAVGVQYPPAPASASASRMPVAFNTRLAFNAVDVHCLLAPVPRMPRHPDGVTNANGVPQQRAGLPPQGGYPVPPFNCRRSRLLRSLRYLLFNNSNRPQFPVARPAAS